MSAPAVTLPINDHAVASALAELIRRLDEHRLLGLVSADAPVVISRHHAVILTDLLNHAGFRPHPNPMIPQANSLTLAFGAN